MVITQKLVYHSNAMSPIPVIAELENLIRKYEDVCTPLDLLRMIGTASKLEEATILLHERMKRDVYSLFGKSDDGTMLSNTGARLLRMSRVIKYHTAHTCNQFHIDAVVELSEREEPVSTTKGKSSGKRKRDERNVLLQEPVFLHYQFTEQTVGAESGSGNCKREKGVTVMESPYKSINLIITICRGAGGLDKATLVDFQLLTAGCSPSQQQISLKDLLASQQENQDDNEADNNSSGSQDDGSVSEGECEGEETSMSGEDDEQGGGAESGSDPDCEMSADGSDGSDGGSGGSGCDDDNDIDGSMQEEGDEGAEEKDTADYYSVNVDTDALALLRDWLQYRSLAQEQEDETGDMADARAHAKKQKGPAAVVAEESSDEGSVDSGSSEAANSTTATVYEKDPALGDLLQFLMSFPYVDEAWGIQDLILNNELGDADGDGEGSDGEEEGSEGSDDVDVLEYCHPCSKH